MRHAKQPAYRRQRCHLNQARAVPALRTWQDHVASIRRF